MRNTLLAIIVSAFAVGGMSLAQHHEHGKVKVTASALRVRAEPSLNGAILGKLPRGQEVKVKGHKGAWLEIEFGEGTKAYIYAKYTTAVAGNEGEEEEQGEGQSQEQKQERPKPVAANGNENQQNEHV